MYHVRNTHTEGGTMPTIADIDAQIAQLQERRRGMAARERERARKLDVRRKIILGGGLIALVGDGDREAAAVLGRLRTALSKRDQSAFVGWVPPEPPAPPTSAPVGEPEPSASQPGPGGPGVIA